METINNVANAAAKAVWGSPESQQEPVSGKRGNTAEGQPYDAGNMRPEEAANLATPADDKLSGAQLGTTANAESSAATASAGSLGGENPSAIGKPELENSDSALGHASKPVAADSAAGGQHDISSPSARPEENPVPEADLAKPGPKPLEVLAREHGGDAGNVGKDGGARTQPSENSEVREESHGDGTGEQYVKSTGFAAEGGDFDAANPGAGREADRLAGEHDGSLSVAPTDKHHGNSASKQTSNSSTGSGEKRSLKEKIKAKLHRH